MAALEATHIWQKYQKGKNHHNQLNLYRNTEKAFRFFEGDQWHGVSNADELPVYNFIAPTVEYKSTMVSMQQVQIVFNAQGDFSKEAEKICADLNTYAQQHWEAQKMDYLCWRIVRDACISGDSYVYFYNRKSSTTRLFTSPTNSSATCKSRNTSSSMSADRSMTSSATPRKTG